jgi:hypothetical protein
MEEKETEGLIDISVSDLKFKKTMEKISEHKKNYIIFKSNTEKIKIKMDKVFLPFGVEIYNKRQILNIEIYPKKNNNHNNIHSMLFAFEQEFGDLNNIDWYVKQELDNISYHSFLKSNGYGGNHIRSYMSPNPEIFTMMGKYKQILSSKDLKGVYCNVELELGTFWINELHYGIIWYVKSIQVI